MGLPYRVWSKRDNQYIEGIFSISFDPTRVHLTCRNPNDTVRTEHFGRDEVVIERHLKDNKYENDIVQDYNDDQEVYTIKWDETNFMFILEAPGHIERLDSVNLDDYHVIGNVHEGIEGYEEEKGDTIVFQYYGRALEMPKRMRKYFNSKGITFEEHEWVSINEYVEYVIENRWNYKK